MSRMRNKSKIFTAILGVGIVFSNVCYGVTWSAKSEAGRQFSFEVEGNLTRSTLTGVLCGVEPVTFQQVKLWMPLHDHGSTRTTITALSDHCARIDRLNFFMAGSWEMRVLTTDGDKFVFIIDIP